jgi:hypothetical protein
MYYPNLKTSDSELRAVRFLNNRTKRNITPIFELTRSRKTKALPNGSATRRLEQLVDVYGDSPFILDLATEEDIINDEIIGLFDEANGYARWLRFIRELSDSKVTPCALYVEDGGRKSFQTQIEKIVEQYGKVCLRTSVADEDAAKLYRWAVEASDAKKIILCGTLYYIEPFRIENYKSLVGAYIENVVGNRVPSTLLFPGSSFPRYVTDRDGGEDLSGEFSALELEVENSARRRFSNLPIEPSDFASVHPIRYPTGGGNWIPRIDIFDGTNYRYVRTRRDDGGYESAAQELKKSLVDSLPDCWGKRQIEEAMGGRVTGGSPSFWISVRINCWITQRASFLV